MEIVIKGNIKEIADLIKELQGQQDGLISKIKKDILSDLLETQNMNRNIK